jgi:integrase
MARGSITRRGGSWTIRVDLGTDPVSGKRRQRRETVRTRKEAEKRLAELLRQAEQGQLQVSPRITLGAYLERWLLDYAATKSPATEHRYRQLIESYVLPHLGEVRLDKLTPMHFVGLQSTLRETPRLDGRGMLSPQSLLHVHRVLHVALRCAVEWRLLAANPMDGAKAPRRPRQEMRYFDASEAARFVAACAEDSPRWEAFFRMLLVTGCRPGELKALTWGDVDLEAGAVTIRRTVQRVKGRGLVVGETKTAGSRRTLALGPDMLATLRRHRALQAEERLRLGPLWRNLGLVFPNGVGGYLEQDRVVRVFRGICERAGLPRIRVYDLRHTSATLLLSSGVDLKTVSSRLGHTTPELVLSTYGHTLPGAQGEASRRLETLLKEAK